ncbi:MAG: type IV secretion system DNA-binding domain-containing protein [Microgenomates group bacterium]|jgi:hypothetical protein
METSSPIPSFIPKTATEIQQLQLLHQVQNGQMPIFNDIVLLVLLKFPLPESWFPVQSRLDMYYALTASSSPLSDSVNAHPLLSSIFVMFWPLWLILSLLLLYFLIKASISFLQVIFPLIFARFLPVQPKTFFELTFPSDTSKSAYATQQLYTLLHTLAKQNNFKERLLGQKNIFGLEIVSTKDQGIRYILSTSSRNANTIRRNLLSYLPGIKTKEIDDYLNEDSEGEMFQGVVEFKLAAPFALPLSRQKTLDEHDPISYLTGNMTKLNDHELISFQIITTPVLNGTHKTLINKMNELRKIIYQRQPLTPLLNGNILQKIADLPGVFVITFFLKVIFSVVKFVWMFVYSMLLAFMDPNSKVIPFLMTSKAIENAAANQQLLNPYEQELLQIVKEKIDQPLFETSIRMLVITKEPEEFDSRVSGLIASFGAMNSTYQLITTKSSLLPRSLTMNLRLNQFKRRLLSNSFIFNQNPILSVSEISDIYHFPYTDLTKTEGLVKSRTRELPSPLSMKKSTTNLDVILGANEYGGEVSPIGLTLAQRQKHMYVIGKTGMGKTTLLTNAIYQDMASGKGLCVLDPHGDMVKELLQVIPKERRKDVIYFDPSDRDFPLGLNILSPGITFSSKEDADEWITSSVIAIFAKLTAKEYWGPRMEHILQNAILTALQTPNPSLFTLQRLLTEKKYQKQVASTLSDPVLKQFWQKEFSLLGTMQLSSVTAPLTHRLGHFITTKMSRHILLQGKSTISIQQIMDEGKILLINLSKGDLGEDQSSFFGTLVTSLIWMAAYQRTKIPEKQRRDFFLYIDEFQNFATPQFSEIMSEGRKFHISLIPSHQNIAQIDDLKLVQIIAGNAGTIISLKGSPDDEQFILPFMQPEVEKGEIVNLPPFHFYMKVSTDNSEDAFSGQTIPLDVKGSEKTAEEIITNTRKKYGTPKAEVEETLKQLFGGETKEKPAKKTAKSHGI